MTETDAATQAYALAQQKIAEAKEDGNTPALTFNMSQFHALNRIPPEIAGLERLLGLDLSNTQISDLSPLAGLNNLESLDLTNTKVSSIAPLAGMDLLYDLTIDGTLVSDLRPILYLKAIATEESGRLSFTQTPATATDTNLNAAASYIGTSRLNVTLDRLRKLPPWHPVDEKLAEGDTSKEAIEQRGLVYAALFRPGADGTVREEGGIDPAISAALSKLLTK